MDGPGSPPGSPAAPVTGPAAPARDEAVLLWIPVGAGGHVVRRTSAWWERLAARSQGREPAPLFHAALELRRGGVPLAVEMAPAWGAPQHHGGHGGHYRHKSFGRMLFSS